MIRNLVKSKFFRKELLVSFLRISIGLLFFFSGTIKLLDIPEFQISDVWNVVGSNSPNLSRSDTKSYYLKCITWNNFDADPINNPAVSNIICVQVGDI